MACLETVTANRGDVSLTHTHTHITPEGFPACERPQRMRSVSTLQVQESDSDSAEDRGSSWAQVGVSGRFCCLWWSGEAGGGDPDAVNRKTKKKKTQKKRKSHNSQSAVMSRFCFHFKSFVESRKDESFGSLM